MHEPILFGYPERWREFHERRPEWRDVYPRLRAALEAAFVRDVLVDDKGSHVVFGLGRVAVEDFAEILLLCGNGYGIGALKILRGMYERVVTALYLARHPAELENFLDYDIVHRRKLITHARNAAIEFRKHGQHVASIEAEYHRIKARFERQTSWTKKDVKTMAEEVGLGASYGPLYFWPTLQHHTTFVGLNARYESLDDDTTTFQEGAQHEAVDLALGGAHTLLLFLLATFDRVFTLALPNCDELSADFARCWRVRPEDIATGEEPLR